MAIVKAYGRDFRVSAPQAFLAPAPELRFQPVERGDAASAAYGRDTVFAPRVVSIALSDALFEVDLVSTTTLNGVDGYRVSVRWLDGWADLPGILRVPAGGGWIGDLMELAPPPGSIAYGFGPPTGMAARVLYVDISGEKPVLYAPEGSAV